MARYYCDDRLILDTVMSSMKSPAIELSQYGSGHSEFKPLPASTTQLLATENSEL